MIGDADTAGKTRVFDSRRHRSRRWLRVLGAFAKNTDEAVAFVHRLIEFGVVPNSLVTATEASLDVDQATAERLVQMALSSSNIELLLDAGKLVLPE